MPNNVIAKIVLVPKNPKFTVFIAIFLVLIVFIAGWLLLKPQNHTFYKSVKIKTLSYKLEVANTDMSRQKGLSGRLGLQPGTGMLFDFKTDGNWGIWMPDMHFDIDVIWLDQTGHIIGLKNNVSPNTYPKVFYASKPSRYVIELPAGAVDSAGLKIGDVVDI